MTQILHTLGRRATLLATALLTLLLLVTAGCDDQPTEVEDYDPEPLLYAWIQANAPVDSVTLEWTSRATGVIDRDNNGIFGADIMMFPIYDADSMAVDTSSDPSMVLRFEEHPTRAGGGVYIPLNDYEPVPTWTYRLEARKPADGVDLWAETVVPDTFSYYTARQDDPLTPVELDGATLTRDEEEIFMVWTESEDARGFVLGIVAQTPKDQIQPLDPDWDPNDPDDEIDPEEVNRHNWTFTRYDQRAMTVAWVFFQWAGPSQLYIHAASPSYYHYMFSLINRQDPSFTENPEWNVHGGLGVFGGYSRHAFDIFLERADPEP